MIIDQTVGIQNRSAKENHLELIKALLLVASENRDKVAYTIKEHIKVILQDDDDNKKYIALELILCSISVLHRTDASSDYISYWNNYFSDLKILFKEEIKLLSKSNINLARIAILQGIIPFLEVQNSWDFGALFFSGAHSSIFSWRYIPIAYSLLGSSLWGAPSSLPNTRILSEISEFVFSTELPIIKWNMEQFDIIELDIYYRSYPPESVQQKKQQFTTQEHSVLFGVFIVFAMLVELNDRTNTDNKLIATRFSRNFEIIPLFQRFIQIKSTGDYEGIVHNREFQAFSDSEKRFILSWLKNEVNLIKFDV